MKRIAALIGLAAVSSLSFAAPVAASSVCPVDPTAEAAPGVDWSGCDLSGAYLSGADLTGANLSGANLTGANLLFADLSNANLSGANLTGALAHARYLFADLSFANLTSADLSGAEFALTNITYVTLTGANLSIARIEFSSFFGATGEPLTDAGAFYNQVTCPDGTIASFDLPQMSCWAPPDEDHDGVLNADDVCPGTVIDAFPHLMANRYSYDGTALVSGLASNPPHSIQETGGCSAMQIIAATGGGGGHEKFGLSRSTLEAWIASLI